MLSMNDQKISGRAPLFSIRCLIKGALVLIVLLMTSISFAAKWTNSSGVTVNAVHTDNVGLDESGEESDLIFTIAPRWSIKGEGAGATFEMIGSSELKDVGGSRQANNLKYQTNADVELIERIFFIDATATASQNAIDPLSKSSNDNISGSANTSNNTDDNSNTTTTYSVNVSPYIKGRLKRFADFEARYTYSHVTSDEIDDGDTSSGQLVVSLDSGTQFGKLTWGVNGSKRTTKTESGSSTDNTSFDVNLGYQINRGWKVTGLLGRESTDYTSDGDNAGGKWELGVVWTPSPRTSLDVGFGSRFSGSSGHLDFSHRSRRSVITASYSQEITDSHGLLAGQEVYGSEDPFGDPIDPVTGDPITTVDGTFLRNINDNDQFLNDRFSMSYTLKGKRTTLSVDSSYTKQTSQDASENSSFGFGVKVNRNLSGLLSADAGLTWDTQKQSDDSKTDQLRFNLGLNQKLGKKTSLSLNYSHTKREADQAGDSYGEDRVTLSLKHDLF